MNKVGKIYPETLLHLMIDVLKNTTRFHYISGTQPFLMTFDGKEYYVYVKNMSSAYFSERPDTTRAQLPIREEFEEIKASPNTFIFLGYDQENDVLICWNYHIAKTRLNEKKSVSFYSRIFFQEEVTSGSFLRKHLKNGDEPILFKRKDLIEFFSKIETFFTEDDVCVEEPTIFENGDFEFIETPANPYVSNGKLLKITEKALIEQLRPIIETNHMLQALKMAEQFYKGKYPAMKLKDWYELIKNIDFDKSDETDMPLTSSHNITQTEQHRSQYIDFMYSQNKSGKTIVRYTNAVSGILTDLIKEYYASEINSIFDTVDVTKLQSWADKLFIRQDFRELNKLKHRDYSCALNKYIEYAGSLIEKEESCNIAAEQVIPYMTPKYCESLFMRFMQDSGLSENSGRYYIQALNGRVTECIKKYLLPELQSIFSILDVQLLYSWTQYLHRNQEFKEMNSAGNRQYSCALNKYIQFVESLLINSDSE